jgi:ABC-type multidrug transport system ATPase subunit
MKLEVDSVNLRFGEHVVLSDVYAAFEVGQLSSLLGRNGSGKSCLFKIIIGSIGSQYASVRVDKIYFPSLFKSKILKYLPQTYIFPESMKIKKAIKFFEADSTNTLSHLESLNIGLETKFGDLSGGQRRLAEIFVFLNSPSPFIILDEPFTYLTPIQIEELKKSLAVYKKKKGIIISDHQYRHVIDVSDKVFLLKSGKTHLLKPENLIQQLRDFMYIL